MNLHLYQTSMSKFAVLLLIFTFTWSLPTVSHPSLPHLNLTHNTTIHFNLLDGHGVRIQLLIVQYRLWASIDPIVLIKSETLN